MNLLQRASIVPSSAQLSVGDAGSTEIPEWQTGEETCVASESVVLVATAADTAGAVSCRIWSGQSAPLWESVVFDGELNISSGAVEAGSIIGNQLIRADVGEGRFRIVIRAYPVEQVEVVDAFIFV
jgi:hypothetical protein